MMSPWGVIEHSERITDGVRQVYTAGHGGLQVNKECLRQVFPTLTHSQIARIVRLSCLESTDYVWFEEDCAMMVAVRYSQPILQAKSNKLGLSESELLARAEVSVNRWFPDLA